MFRRQTEYALLDFNWSALLKLGLVRTDSDIRLLSLGMIKVTLLTILLRSPAIMRANEHSHSTPDGVREASTRRKWHALLWKHHLRAATQAG